MTTKGISKDLVFRVWLKSSGVIDTLGMDTLGTSTAMPPGTLQHSLYKQLEKQTRVDKLLAAATSYLRSTVNIQVGSIKTVDLRILDLHGDADFPLLVFRMQTPFFTPELICSNSHQCSIFLQGLVAAGVISHA